MYRSISVGGTLAAVALTLACAAGTPQLSSTQLSAADLSELEYGSLYEFLEAHNRVRVTTTQGVDALMVRARERQRSLASPGGSESPGRPPEGASRPGSGGEGGAAGEGGGAGGGAAAAGSSYRPALLYVDGSEESDPVNWLRDVQLEEVESLRILRPSEASSRFGGSGDRPAVAVELKD